MAMRFVAFYRLPDHDRMAMTPQIRATVAIGTRDPSFFDDRSSTA
jgi:hypothetical protein